MMMKELLDFLELNSIPYIEDADMSGYTTFRTGGKASVLILPESREQILSLLKADICEYIVLGSCSNVLVSDKGIDVPVILFQKNFSDIHEEGGIIYADAGARLSALTGFSISNGWKGLEFAGGIPGSVGGGVFMNAGAYGGELKDCIKEVFACTLKGEPVTFENSECCFSYRHSVFADNDMLILGASFSLEKGDPEESRRILLELNKRRMDKQPLEYPNAGSTFKRPEGYFAGSLIEGSSLKGVSVGGAEVSEKHAGFIINKGNATSSDIYELIKLVQDEVYIKKGVRLEPEVRFIGDFE